jgi:hypothetical protein
LLIFANTGGILISFKEFDLFWSNTNSFQRSKHYVVYLQASSDITTAILVHYTNDKANQKQGVKVTY